MLVARWLWGLLTATGSVLLDRQAPAAVCAKIRQAIDAVGDARPAGSVSRFSGFA